jgi:type III secretion protein Q
MVTPYPFERLHKATRPEVELLRYCARRIPRINTSSALSTAAKLLGVAVSCKQRTPELCTADRFQQRLLEPLVVAVLEKGTTGPSSRLLVEIPPQLASAVVDRALGGDGAQAPTQGLLGMDDLSRGVLGYVIARVLESAGASFYLRAILTGKSPVLTTLGEESAVLLPIATLFGQTPFVLHLWTPAATVRAFSSEVDSDYDAAAVSALALVTVTLSAKAGAAQLNGQEWRSLATGDVVVLDRCGLCHIKELWSGTVDLAVEGAARTVWRCNARDVTLEVDSVKTTQEIAVEESGTHIQQDRDAENALNLASDAPVELSVEIARFTLTLAELGKLKPGEILLTRRPIGERVVLRAGRHALASGELVDVDGEVGVRILSPAFQTE